MKQTLFDADYWIKKLDLQPHPEGGRYRETFVSGEVIATQNLGRYNGEPRKAYTLIYYLLKSGQVSRLHRLRSDEIWLFHAGATLTIHLILPDGKYVKKMLGPDIDNGDSLQHIVRHGCWFGASVESPATFALVSCFVSPGFDMADFEMGDKQNLLRQFPQHQAVIDLLFP